MTETNDSKNQDGMNGEIISGSANSCDNTSLPVCYPQSHLLGLPAELRHKIWALIHFAALTETEDDVKWNDRREIRCDGVQFTCRKMYEETRPYWPRSVIRVGQIPEKLVVEGITIPIVKRFQHLTLELPRDYSSFAHDGRTVVMLDLVAPFLKEIRLFFVGRKDLDGCYTRFSKNCLLETERERRRKQAQIAASNDKNLDMSSVVKALPKSGSSNWSTRAAEPTIGPKSPKALVDCIQRMKNLRTLVLHDIPMLFLSSALLNRKPFLEELHVTTSPDSILHAHPYGVFNPYVPAVKSKLCIEKISLSANSILDASKVIFESFRTLTDLTWTVPNMDERHDVRCNWVQQTGDLIQILGVKAKNLKSLKICIESEICEDHFSHSYLVGSIKRCLKLISSLEVLELHILTDSQFLPAEVIEALPLSLKRFYTTEDFIDAKLLTREIERRYLKRPTCPNLYSPTIGGKLGFIGYEYTTKEAWMAILKLNGRLLDRERNLQRLSEICHDGNELDATEGIVWDTSCEKMIMCRREDEWSHEFLPMPLHEVFELPEYNEKGDFRHACQYYIENEILEEIRDKEKAVEIETLTKPKWICSEPVRVGEHWLSDKSRRASPESY